MMPGANDYAPVADLYDDYVQVDFDLDFFGRRAARCSGPVLELMAGTGRVTHTIHNANRRLTCLDLSLEMLRVLQRKVTDLSPGPWVVCADVRSLPLKSDYYSLAVIPFNSFAELTAFEDQRGALIEICRVLAGSGELICTLHNPSVRLRSLHAHPELLAAYDVARDRRIEVWVGGVFDPVTNVARSTQTYRIYDSRGELQDERVQDVQFALIGPDVFASLAESAGFTVIDVLGDYDGSTFSLESSPYMIWILQKA
jgi:ubiquinone/menaquinone biosynthesis C-methylase UbiE